MGCPRVRASILRLTVTSLALCAALACAGGSPESGAAGTAGAEPFGLQVTPAYISVENRTGAPLVGGQLEIVQTGILPPYRSNLPRLEVGSKQDLPLANFRDRDGTNFNRSVARPRTVRITAKDLNGKEYEQEIPFE